MGTEPYLLGRTGDGVKHIVRWCDWNGKGLDHCILSEGPDALRMEGVLIADAPVPFGAHYSVAVGLDWRTSEVRIACLGGPSLHVKSDRNGNWRDLLHDVSLPLLHGCVDVDIGMTPATNTLPIRRIGLRQGESHEILAAYIAQPDRLDGVFVPRAVRQRYTCIETDRRYIYEGLETGFLAEIEVDDAGLVLDYPAAFRRQHLALP